MCENRSRASAAWCGQCYENLRGRASHRGHLGYRAGPRRPGKVTTMALRKPTANPIADSIVPTATIGELALFGPTTWEYLTAVTWEDGSPRVPCSLLVFYELGKWKLCVNDRGLGRTGWVTGNTPSDVFSAVERALMDDSLDWRKARPGKK